MTTKPKKLSLAFVTSHIVLALLILGIDQASKLFVLHQSPQSVLLNSGVIGGLLQDHHPLVKTLSIANTGLIVSLIYLYLAFFVVARYRMLSLAITALYAAILANLIDRIKMGAVIDFIEIKLGAVSAFLNIADFIQQAAVVLITFYILKHRKQLVRADEKRGQYLLDARTQLGGAIFFALITFVVGVGISSINYIYFNSSSVSPGIAVSDYIWLVVLASLFCSLIVFVFTVLYTFRYIGPIFALKKYLDQFDTQASPRFHLRQNDFFKFLEDSVNKALNRPKDS